MSHHKLRQSVKNACLQLSPLFQEQATVAIIKQLQAHPLLKSKQHIGVYYPFGHEVDIRPWFAYAWTQGHHCYLPVTLENHLIFGTYTSPTRLQTNHWGIVEPNPDDVRLKPESLDIVLVPLVAFDAKGYRLGRGKGYYDRTFSFLLQQARVAKPYLIGLAYALQKVDQLIPAPWDVPLNEVITESQHYYFN